MGEDGKLEKTGVPAALVNAWFNRFGIVPTRVTDFQVMFLFSIGVTKGKWGTLLANLLAFKRDYDANRPLTHSLPEIAAAYPQRYGTWACTTSATSCSSTCAGTVPATSSTQPSLVCPRRT